jgi:hypothetical protein
MGNTGKYWEILGNTGKYWEILGNTDGKYWEILGNTGKYWEILGIIKFTYLSPVSQSISSAGDCSIHTIFGFFPP